MAQFIYIIFSAFLIISTPSTDKDDYTHHSVSIKSGDGIWSLLRRYDLNQSKCNIDEFYELNALKADSHLKIDKKYKIPVLIYEYDQKSIRSTIGINDWDTAIKIKEYNESILAKGLRKKTYQESNVLWVPHEFINCKAAKEKKDLAKTKSPKNENVISDMTNDESPALSATNNESKKTLTNTLFGKEYENVEIIDQTLYGKVFYVVSGHGGRDPGAVCEDAPTDMCEDEYAYDVALRLSRNLLQHGATVEMVIQDNDGIRDEQYLQCDTDEKLADGSKIPNSQNNRLRQRTVYVNKKHKEYQKKGFYDQYLISLHVDSRTANKEQDVFFCHYPKSKSSKKLATSLKDKFKEMYDKHQKNRGYKGHLSERNLYVLMNTAPPATLIELANIQNKSDHRRIKVKENRQALANWICEGLAEHALSDSQQQVATP